MYASPVLRSWHLTIELNAEFQVPLYLQLARAISSDIQRGRLSAGDALPGTRAMAVTLGVHRNTVTAAYEELIAQGWAESVPSRGTFVSQSLPEPSQRQNVFKPRGRRMPSRPKYELASDHLGADSWRDIEAELPRRLLKFTDGTPDIRLAPVRELARAYRRALNSRARSNLLAYGDPRGHASLRKALAEMLNITRALIVGPDDLMVTRGSQMALFLIAKALVAPGDTVAVEELGYSPAWNAFKLAGARIISVPVDEGGISVEVLEKLSAKQRIRAVYVTPHHQYPTTVTLQAGRRLRLLQHASETGIAIIEDDYDHEFHYEGRPILPLASADTSGAVIYISSLSKIIAPGLRIGYVVAPRAVIERLAAVRAMVDRQGDMVIEQAVAELISDGELQRHARKARRDYLIRREALSSFLSQELKDFIEFSIPSGGMALWVRVIADINVEEWATKGLNHGVSFSAGRHFSFDSKSISAVRLGFASLSVKELREATRRMAAALPLNVGSH